MENITKSICTRRLNRWFHFFVVLSISVIQAFFIFTAHQFVLVEESQWFVFFLSGILIFPWYFGPLEKFITNFCNVIKLRDTIKVSIYNDSCCIWYVNKKYKCIEVHIPDHTIFDNIILDEIKKLRSDQIESFWTPDIKVEDDIMKKSKKSYFKMNELKQPDWSGLKDLDLSSLYPKTMNKPFTVPITKFSKWEWNNFIYRTGDGLDETKELKEYFEKNSYDINSKYRECDWNGILIHVEN